MDLSVLDVLQVFGRAGRPGLESSGEGYICTTEDKLTHYLDAVTSQVSKLTTAAVNEYTDENSQHPIESQSVVVPLILEPDTQHWQIPVRHGGCIECGDCPRDRGHRRRRRALAWIHISFRPNV